MNLIPYFKSRANGTVMQPGAGWAVASCSWAVGMGGCEGARLRARVKRASMAELVDLLRCGLELHDSSGSVAWWGWVKVITVREGKTGAAVSLDSLANRVRVGYELTSETLRGGGIRYTTAWADNLDSQAVYGVKEKQLELSITTPAQAQTYRSAQLEKLAKPRLMPAFFTGACEDCELEIDAAGWFETLGWKYYALDAGLVEYITEGAGVQPLGELTANTKIAQSFQPGTGGWVAGEVWLDVRRQGSPADNLQVELCPDSSGVPGSAVASISVAGATLGDDFTWLKCSLGSTYQFTVGAMYWIVLSRSGAVSAPNHYRLRVNEALGYTGGVLRLWGGSSWAARSPDADLLFRVAGNQESTAQVAAMAAADEGGQFLAGVRLDAASGVYTNPFRFGDDTCLEEIAAHLAAGNSSGVELLALVNLERYLVIYAKPAESTAEYRIDSQGNLLTLAGAEVEAFKACQIAGQWAVMDAAWQGQGIGAAMVSERFFVERLSWAAGDGRLRVLNYP